MTFDAKAVRLILEYTEGYPYFIQEFGRAVWNLAEGPKVTAAEAVSAQALVEAELDESFFRSRIQRSTAEERRYMRAMAELGSDAQKAADVAEVLGKASEQVAPLRARLINKGLLYTPRYGYAEVHRAAVRPLHAAPHGAGLGAGAGALNAPETSAIV